VAAAAAASLAARRGHTATVPVPSVNARALWGDALALTMQHVVKNRSVKPGLPVFGSAGGTVYRPTLTTFEQTSTEMQSTIAFIEMPDELEYDAAAPGQPRPDPNVVTLSHLLKISRMFRWGIILRFQRLFARQADQGVFDELRIAISNLYVDSQSRGIDADVVVSVFTAEPFVAPSDEWAELIEEARATGDDPGRVLTERAVVAHILARWERDTMPLAQRTADQATAVALLRKMRYLNRRFYELCARRMSEYLIELEE
jgi:hypothetical protein